MTRRGELAAGVPPSGPLDREFLRRLEKIDPEITLYWHPVVHRWVVYRRVKRAYTTQQADDLLVKEFVLQSPTGGYLKPGRWLLDRLYELDKYRRGAVDEDRANYEATQWIRDEPARLEAEEDARRLPLSEAIAKDITWLAKGRDSIVSNWDPT